LKNTRPSATRAIKGSQAFRGCRTDLAMRRGERRGLIPFIEPEFVAERVEKMKASIRAKVEHPFRVFKRQFGLNTVHYRGLTKNTVQIVTLFALSNMWMARRRLMEAEA